MYKSILLPAITAVCAFSFSSCASYTTQPMQPRVSVEESERQGQDIAPNLNHGQHEAGQNAVDYSNSRNRLDYGVPRLRY